jgi:uncharacterized protein
LIAVETNILVYAHRQDSPWHAQAKQVMAGLAASRQWAIPWPCVHEFISIVTRPRYYVPPSTLQQAFDQLDAWMESPGIVMIGETRSHMDTLRAISVQGKVTGPLIHDARIAAICIQHGVSELWTSDRDFQYFPGQKTRNPLVS